MSSTANAQGLVQADGKAMKKRKNKGEAQKSTDLGSKPSLVERAPSRTSHDGSANVNGSKDYESPYLKELYKSIRNVNKKLNAAAKVEALVAESPGQTLDELVAARKINGDQKAQIQKIPSLQSSLAQLEEQVAQYKKFDQEYQTRLDAEKANLEASHQKEIAALTQAVEDARVEGRNAAKAEERSNLLILTQFLRAAAAKRMEEDLAGEPENRAFEGVLLLVYGGDESAIQAIEKLLSGSTDSVTATDGSIIPDITYAHVKQASLAYGGINEPTTSGDDPDAAVNHEGTATLKSDLTLANAGLTELEDNPVINGGNEPHVGTTAPPQTNVGSNAANPAAEENWDSKMTASVEGPDGWVQVARDPAETETGLTATPAATAGTQSWADDHPVASTTASQPQPTSTANANDGFHEVHHSRGTRGRGSFSGERSGYRGRGNYRGGDGGGYRGRGGYRGDRGGDRGFRGRGRGRGMRDSDHSRREDS